MTLELQVGKRYRTIAGNIYTIIGTHKDFYYGVEETDGACVRFHPDGSSYYSTNPRLVKEVEIVYLAVYRFKNNPYVKVFTTEQLARDCLNTISNNKVFGVPIGVLEVDLSTCQ